MEGILGVIDGVASSHLVLTSGLAIFHSPRIFGVVARTLFRVVIWTVYRFEQDDIYYII